MIKNKIIIISLIFILLILNFTIVFAGYETGEYPPINFDTKGYNVENGYLLVDNNGKLNIIILPAGFSGNVILNGSSIYLSNNARYMINEYLGSGSWNNAITSTKNDNINTIYYSTLDVYDPLGNLVFQVAPPIVEPEVKTVTETLVQETEKVQIAEQLKTMIAGFLKYLIALVISLIAFWKGWQFLSTQLRKA